MAKTHSSLCCLINAYIGCVTCDKKWCNECWHKYHHTTRHCYTYVIENEPSHEREKFAKEFIAKLKSEGIEPCSITNEWRHDG